MYSVPINFNENEPKIDGNSRIRALVLHCVRLVYPNRKTNGGETKHSNKYLLWIRLEE